MPEIMHVNDRDGEVEVVVREGGFAWGIILPGESAASLAAQPSATALAAIAAADIQPPRAHPAGQHPLVGKTL